MGILKKFFNQTRKPEGTLGKMMLSSLNSGHAKLADWGFTHLPPITPETAVDLGCGAGRNAAELLKMYPDARVTAVDYSALSVEKAQEYNRDMPERMGGFTMQRWKSLRKKPLIISGTNRHTVIRFATSWATTAQDISSLCRILENMEDRFDH